MTTAVNVRKVLVRCERVAFESKEHADAWQEISAAIEAYAELVAAQKTIKQSIAKARVYGNDWRRELALIENTVDAALAVVKGDEK